jgi:hypothetical protein
MKMILAVTLLAIGCGGLEPFEPIEPATATTTVAVAPEPTADPVPVQCGTRTCAPDEGCNLHYIYGGELFTCGKLCNAHSQCPTGCCYPQAGEPGVGVCTVTHFCDHARGNGHDVDSWWPTP